MNTTMKTSPMRRTGLLLASIAAASLALTACSGGKDDAAAPAEKPAASQSADKPAEDNADPHAEPSDVSAENELAYAAVDTALAQYGGSVAYEFDREDDGTFTVDVALDGVSYEVDIDKDGTTVLKSEKEDLDADERAEIDAATTTLKEAMAAALGEQDGVLENVELDHEDDDKNKTLRWEVDIETGSGEVEIYISAADGAVLGRNK